MNARTDLPLGLFHDLPIETYHASPGISNSGLNDFAQSPAHYFGLHRDPARPAREEKPGQLEGTLAHCAILEPLEFDRRYAVVPDDAPRRPTDAQWKAKKPSPESVEAMQWWTAWGAAHVGMRVITTAQRDTALAQARVVRSVPDVAKLLSVGRAEVSAFWIDPATGQLCRCRPDWVHPVGDRAVILVDVKTCSDASPADFARQVARKGYHRQDAFYTEGYSIAAGVSVVGFVFIAVEAAWPHAACAVMLDDESRDRGRASTRELITRFDDCDRTNTWPGYSAEVEVITLPQWAA